MKITVEKSFEVSDQDIGDILCAAFEGGINYWCGKAEVKDRGDYEGYASDALAQDKTIILHDVEEEEEKYELTKENFLKGLTQWIKERPERDDIFYDNDGTCELECGSIDADDADAIVQLAALGEIVFG